MRRDRPRAQLGRRPAAEHPLDAHDRLRGPRQGHDRAPPRHPPPPARHLRGDGRARGDRAPDEARRDRGGAAAGAGVLRRPLPRREGAQELLGLQHAGLLRPGPALPDRARQHRRVQADGPAPARGGHRGHHGRGLQPHRRGQPDGPDAVVPRHRQRELLRPGRRPALHLRHHRHRQQPQPQERPRAPDGHGQLALLGRGLPRRRLPLRPRLDAGARPRRLRPRFGVFGGHAPGSRPEPGQAHRRALGHGAGRLPARQLPARLGRVGTTSTAT